jgi:hypothetical protein
VSANSADVAHGAEQRAAGGAQERDEEDQAEEHPPESPAERARLRGVVHLVGLGLLLADLPADDRRIVKIDQEIPA